MKSKIRVYTVRCRRGCGKLLATSARSIWGVPDCIHDRYQGICGDCLTPEEHREIFEATQSAVARRCKNG